MIRVSKEQFLEDLKEIVNIDSYSYDVEGVNQVAAIMRKKFEDLGWHIEEKRPSETAGPILEITNKPDATEYDVLLLGHMDTVFAKGTVAERPFTMDDTYAYGPGVADMKDGLISIYYLCKSLQENNELDDKAICVCFNPDEEVSSKASRPFIEALAKKSRYCLVLESARLNGNCVNERKGIGKYVVEFFGKAAHAAVNPEDGANALNQFLITGQEILSWSKPEIGTTINIGTVKGGTTPNTIPDYIHTQIDVRIRDLEEGARMDALLHDIPNHLTVRGVTAKVTGSITRPPMVPNEKTMALCAAIDEIKVRLGIEDGGWESAAGGSDGNFTASLGVPTVCGFGPKGGKVHSADEKLEINTIIERLELAYETIKYCASH